MRDQSDVKSFFELGQRTRQREVDGILFGEREVAEVVDHAEHGLPRAAQKIFVRRGEERRIAPETVHEKSRQQRTLRGGERHAGPEKRCVNAAAVNVADKQDGGVRVPRHVHVHDIAGFEVDFPRRARALQNHDDLTSCVA